MRQRIYEAAAPVIGLPDSVRIFPFTQPADMRKGFDGLVLTAGENVCSGHPFVFISKRRDRAKILTFQKGGFVLWYKRLERGRFKPLQAGREVVHVKLDATELALLIDGIDIRRVQRPKHWQPQTGPNAVDIPSAP